MCVCVCVCVCVCLYVCMIFCVCEQYIYIYIYIHIKTILLCEFNNYLPSNKLIEYCRHFFRLATCYDERSFMTNFL